MAQTALAFAAALLLAACNVQGLPAEANSGIDFPELTGRVVDKADLLTPAQEQRLEAEAEAVEREIGPQFVVVTVKTLQGRPILEYGVDLGRHWGIGHEERNDGVILLVAPNEQSVRIEVGYGLERRVTDPFADRVLREQVLPRFREGRYPDGILAGSEAIIARLRSRQSDREIAAADGVVQ